MEPNAIKSDSSPVRGGEGRGAISLALGVSVVAGIGWCGLLALTIKVSEWSTPQGEPELPLYHLKLAEKPAGAMLDAEGVEIGHEIYMETCLACHGSKGTGIRTLGKDLVHSDFIVSQSDEALAAFIKRGRDPGDPLNTTGVGMPPKGGNPTLADGDMQDIVTYLRALQDPRRVPPGAIKQAPAPTPSPARVSPSPTPASSVGAGPGVKPVSSVTAGASGATPETVEHGRSIFLKTCAACHGVDAHGIVKMGKDLIASAFAKDQTDDALVEFIKRGRDPGDKANTTKVAMPPRGGNPALSDDDLYEVVDYVRALQRSAGGI